MAELKWEARERGIYDEFVDWLRDTYGGSKATEIINRIAGSSQSYIASPEYAEFHKWYTRTPAEVAANLPEHVSTDEYELEDLPPLGEGFEWYEYSTDPATGLPVEPEWRSRPIEEEEGIGKVIVPGKLVLMPDGTYQDYASGLPVDANVAARIIDEYKPEEEGLTPWQVWQTEEAERAAALEREQFEWQVSEAEKERALGAAGTARERELADRLRLQQELAQLGGPADWIKRWQMIHGIIPKAEYTHLLERASLSLQEAQSLTGAERLTKELQAEKLWSSAEKLLVWEELGEGARAGRFPDTTPEAPEWLPQFVGSQVAGEPITKDRTTTPSGQQWTATPWSVREGLRGYTEFAGYRPYSDILDEMAMMQTRTPTGAGRTQWKPATQRV